MAFTKGKQRGFALMELIIGILAVIIFGVGVWTYYNQNSKVIDEEPSPAPQATPTLPDLSETSNPTTAPAVTTALQDTSQAQNKIAFVRDKDIWLINADGSGERRILEFWITMGLGMPLRHQYIGVQRVIGWRLYLLVTKV